MPTWTKEQKSAIEESGTNIIVSAGAGSGKTAVLSERVLGKLDKGIHIDELLILTFTRAAAEEMKDRIRKKIKKASSLKEELDRLESSYITTFDSFALSVLKKYHYLLNLPSDIEVTEDSIVSLKKIEILDEVFEREYELQEESFIALVEKFSLKSDRTLKETILSLANKIEGYSDKYGFLNILDTEFFEDANLNSLIDEFAALIDEKKHTLKLELNNAYHYFDEDYNSKLDSVILPILNTKNIEELISLSGSKLPPLKRGTDDEAKEIKDILKSAMEDLLSLTEYGTERDIKTGILKTKNTIQKIVDIIRKYFKRLESYKLQNGIYTFSDIATLAIRLLKEHESARLELKDKFKEIMIDEYQDTNDIQETFISLISNDNVYMVGDIKQSIYRFRGSNPDIFKNKYDRYSKNQNGLKIDLIKNFRSRKEVLDNINHIFDLLMDDELGGAAYTESHEMVYGNTSYDEARIDNFNYDMEVLEYLNPKENEWTNIEVEIFAIAKDIIKKKESSFRVFDKDTAKLRPFNYSDAVIILDRSTYFDQFKKIFEYLGIPLTILKDDVLTSKTDIYIIKNLIELLTHIKDGNFDEDFRYAFLSIGRSFLYEYDDEYLFDILTTKNYKETSLYKDIAGIDGYNTKTVRELITELLDKTDFLSKLYKVGDYKATMIRIENVENMATTLGKKGYTIDEFKDYLKGILEIGLDIKYTPAVVDHDSVRILTIHKSKGLEYPVCYFADLDHDFNTRELKDKLIVDSHYGIISGIEDEDGEEDDTILKLLYKNTFYKNEISEKIRLFYVALTRAREHIMVVLPKKDTRKLEKNRVGTIETARRIKFKKLSDFIYGIKDYMPEYFDTIELESLNLTKDYLYKKSSKSVTKDDDVSVFTVENLNINTSVEESKIFSKSNLELLTKEQYYNMTLGTKIHEILEYIDFKNYDPSKIEDDFIQNKITKLLKNELFKNIKEAEIYKEFEFIYEKDSIEYRGSIDLMLEYDNHIDIIDYKLKNTVDEHYKDQLDGYREYITSISSKPTNTYLYSIIDETITKIR